jgi:guanylate kinase
MPVLYFSQLYQKNGGFFVNKRNIPNIVIISAPSGAGKSTLIKGLNKIMPLKYSISHTTRSPRAGEKDGVEYHFVTLEKFQELSQEGAFIETAFIHSNWYGTSWQSILSSHESEDWLILDIDINGFRSVKKNMPDIVSIFVLPPSLDVLKERILHRQPLIDSFELHERLSIAKTEISAAFEYDYIVLNQDIDKSVDELSFILRCEKLRCLRRHDLIRSLCC